MKLVTDSAADMPVEEIRQLDVRVAPLTIHFPEGQVDSENITPDDFYARMKAMYPNTPTTSQPSSGVFAQMYQELAREGEPILSVHISSGLSGTIASARAGAEQVPQAEVTFVDTLTLSGGERFQVLAARMGIQAGWSKDAILERLQKISKATEVAYTLDTLHYLARGGRIGRVQALAGALLKIKPVITVDKIDGKYNNTGRGRTIGKALEVILDYLENVYHQTPLWVTVLHGQFQEQADVLSALVPQRLKVAKLEVLRISPVLGVHTGPAIIGLATVPFELMQGIEA